MNNDISRRNFISSCGILAASLVIPKQLFSQSINPIDEIKRAAKYSRIKTINLRGNISVLEGSGGNIAVLNSKNGKLLVDAGFSNSKPNLSAALHKISDQPIKYLINTHWHFDHTDGNEWIHATGAKVIAHQTTRNYLMRRVRVAGLNYTFEPANKQAWPGMTFKNEQTFDFGGETILMQHYKPAHTDSDISVHFQDANVIHVGDTWVEDLYPFIDYSTGGSATGMIKATEVNIAKCNDRTLIIPGHGNVGNRQSLIVFRDMLADVHEKISTYKKQGKLIAEIIDLKPTNKYDDRCGGGMLSPKAFVSQIYSGIF